MKTSPVRWLVALLAAALGGALWMAGGLAAILYAALFVLAVLPGVPIGVALFGARHPAAWIGGALLGYGLTQMTLWAVIAAGLASTMAFVAAWLALLGATWLATRDPGENYLKALSAGGTATITMPAFGRADLRALLLVLLLAPALIGPPYANLGRADADGHRYYRAYFTADFVWHGALAFELGRFSLPPRNPYMTPRAMNYYWTYFLLPATAAELASPDPTSFVPLQSFLKANAMLVGTLMIGMLFLVVRAAVPSAWPAAVAVCLAVVACSAEGLYAIVDLLSRGRPLAALLDTNIDAVTAWQFQGLRIDNVPRSLWYTPQHTTSVALGLVAWLIALAAGAAASLPAIVGAGLALGLATTMNPLLGASFSIVYGVCISVDAVRRPGGVMLVPRHIAAAVPVALAVGWGTLSRVTDGAGSALDVGFHGFSRNSPVVTLLLSLGPVLVPALLGILPWRRGGEASSSIDTRAVSLAVAALLFGLLLLYFVRISEASWVGFRAGQILLVSIPILLARTFAAIGPRLGLALALVIFVVGVPTTAIDTWNAQDIGNRRPGPGFRWTLSVTPDQQAAFTWLRAHTPPTAVVQMEPTVRAREHWTLIPTFAGRRMAAGLPISLLPLPDYDQRSALVRTAFATASAQEASAIVRRLRIDYLYVDGTDTAAYAKGTRKFDEAPALFEKMFTSGDVCVYRVR